MSTSFRPRKYDEKSWSSISFIPDHILGFRLVVFYQVGAEMQIFILASRGYKVQICWDCEKIIFFCGKNNYNFFRKY